MTIQPGQFLLGTADPAVSGAVRLDFALQPDTLIPGIAPRPDGTAALTYPGSGKVQMALPVFADLPAFLSAAGIVPGVAGLQPQADGTVTVRVGGQALRLRPDFVVTRSPGTTKRILAAEGTLVFDTGDGRRQRFTIVP